MSTEQSEQSETPRVTPQQSCNPQVDITQQATTTTPTTAVKKIPSVWLLANWLLKERGWPVNNRKKLQLRLLS